MRHHANQPSDGLELFLVAGEESGDQLGAALMRALRKCAQQEVRFRGVGGREMTKEGIASLYPIDDLPLIGFSAIPRRLPGILRLMRFTAREVVTRRPQGLIIIDSPGFTRGIARRVRLADPSIPIIEYVSPSVWAWSYRAEQRVMRGYIDHILGVAAVRARGPPEAGRSRVHLCWPPLDGKRVAPASEFGRGLPPSGVSSCAADDAGEQDGGDQATFRRVRAGRLEGND